MAKFYAHLIVSITAAGLTIFELSKVKQTGTSQKSNSSKKGGMTIAFLNFGIMVAFPMHVACYVLPDQNNFKQYSQMFGMTLIPTLISAWNPVIIITRSAKIQNWLKGKSPKMSIKYSTKYLDRQATRQLFLRTPTSSILTTGGDQDTHSK